MLNRFTASSGGVGLMLHYKRAVITGDVHLDPRVPAREIAFCRFLDWVIDHRPDALILLGDIFEFWFGYDSIMFSRFLRPIVRLGTIRNLGIDIHYLVGNHDFLPGRVFSEYLDIQVHDDPILIRFGETLTYLSHGDEINSEDRGYQFLKSILRNPISQRLFRLIPASFAWHLGRVTSDTSRRYTQHKNEMSPATFDCFVQKLAEQNITAIIHGHTHHPMDRIMTYGDRQIRHINAGHWFGPGHYILADSGAFELKSVPIG